VEQLGNFQELYRQSSMKLKDMESMRGTEKRILEKQLRMARIAGRLLTHHVEKQREFALAQRELEDQEELSQFVFQSHHTRCYRRIRALAKGVPDEILLDWAVYVCDEQLGFDEMFRRQLSEEFMVYQAIDFTAVKIQRAWRSYVIASAAAAHEQEIMSALGRVDALSFSWRPGDGEMQDTESVADSQSASPLTKKKKEKKGDAPPVHSRYLEKTQSQQIRDAHVRDAISARQTVLQPGIGGRDPYVISVKEHLRTLPIRDPSSDSRIQPPPSLAKQTSRRHTAIS